MGIGELIQMFLMDAPQAQPQTQQQPVPADLEARLAAGALLEKMEQDRQAARQQPLTPQGPFLTSDPEELMRAARDTAVRAGATR